MNWDNTVCQQSSSYVVSCVVRSATSRVHFALLDTRWSWKQHSGCSPEKLLPPFFTLACYTHTHTCFDFSFSSFRFPLLLLVAAAAAAAIFTRQRDKRQRRRRPRRRSVPRGTIRSTSRHGTIGSSPLTLMLHPNVVDVALASKSPLFGFAIQLFLVRIRSG